MWQRQPVRFSARRRARSTTLWAAAVLLALNIAFGAYVALRPGFRDPVWDMKTRAMAAHFDRPDQPLKVIVLGSSRTAAAVEPGALEVALGNELGRPVVAFNMAMQGDGPISQLIHFRRLLAAGLKPDIVVIELLPPGFAWIIDRPYDFAVLRPERLARKELPAVVHYGYPERETLNEWRESAFNPWYGARFQLLARVQRLWLPTGVVTYQKDAGKLGGWNPWSHYPPHLQRLRIAEVKRAYEAGLPNIRFDGPHAAALDDLLRECRQAGVRAAVIVPPEGSEFRSWYPQRVNVELNALLARLRQEHGALLVDARDWMPDEAFVDTHHIVRTWAKPYTERLARDVIAPLERSQPPR